ncbi:MAG: FAD-dependent oxidoreductase [Oscillospiraceae bacterium]|nr:FAD-dependent oxidoreductase [Oscillospiraceae bacterium]
MYDIIIIGAGPAGLTAAIYAQRAGKRCLIIEKGAFGGQISLSPKLENYPGFTAISGTEFSDRLVEQALGLGAEVELDEVTAISQKDGVKTVTTLMGEFKAKAIIIAAGAKHRRLGLEREEELTGMGVSYCAVCDGAFFKGLTVAVVGGGSSALQDAIMLSDGCEKVYLIYRSTLRGEKQLVDTLRKRENVEFIAGGVVTELKGEFELEAITVKTAEGEREIPLQGLFAAVGYEPDNAPFASLIKLDGGGYAEAGENCLTQTEGVYVAGDCRSKAIRQVTTAVADGAVAALAACGYIDSL